MGIVLSHLDYVNQQQCRSYSRLDVLFHICWALNLKASPLIARVERAQDRG